MAQWQVGVDVGGTFTDILAVEPESGLWRIGKVPSTPEDQSRGVIAGLESVGVPLVEVAGFVHGTTVGTNAVLERKGVPCGLITTQGFRDMLELGRRTRPNAYGMTGSFEALVPREMRIEVPERMGAAGQVLTPLDEDAVRRAVQALREAGAEALVIHFLHSYANPAHELRAAEIVRELWPNPYVTVGHDVLREVREFERGSTAAVNAYIQPLMSRYLSRLAGALERGGFPRTLLVMQGNAGTMTAKGAAEHAAQTVMSGPAAGALAAARVGVEAGMRNIIGCDMGGTSFDVTLIRDGAPAISAEKDVAYGVPVRVPMIDIHTIGAGGGSIARVNQAGLLQVGPESAGSRPGPICYGRGGTEPTVTDANLVLGRLDPASMPGVESPVPVEVVQAAILEKIGKPLGLDAIAAASAIIAVATNHLASAIRLVSIERGEDPRDYALFAFGGAGPLHATALAQELGVPQVLVPRFPGATSALGCILADLRHDFVRTIGRPLLEVEGAAMEAILAEHAAQGRALIEGEGVPIEGIVTVHEADLLFRGQSHVFRMAVTLPFAPAEVLAQFTARYRQRFDIELAGMRVVLANLRTTVLGTRRKIGMALFAPEAVGEPVPRTSRQVVFGTKAWTTPIYRRETLPAGHVLPGPAIIEQMDATTVVDPGATLRVDSTGNLVISVGAAA
ncbi:hydantoinase/oxoprolinase family protein [Siccirubricoccus phaeus]|uniref:hydantoinase/oxoprolinase family protein n=1 Tax=Siccirubricoccus phaeus TaxID=2595053 RepID=UPI0011F2EA54|nr:hydantoinase/oxoprolinase family protein [Siccirubricoccus phaeus]